MKRHFVITTLGTAGDIFPFIEIGKYLIEKGCKVSLITNPYFKDVVENNGLNFIPFGTAEQWSATLNDPALWNPKTGFNTLWAKAIRPNTHCVRLYVQSLPDEEEVVILSHPALMALANLAKADHENLKVVLFYLYPTIIRSRFSRVALGGSMSLSPKAPVFLRNLLYSLLDKRFLDVGIVPDLNKERTRLGLPAIDHLFPHLQKSADLYVTLFPEWYASTKPDYPKPLINGNFVFYTPSDDRMSDELTEFLDAGQPPILFTAGSGNLHAKKFFEIALDAVEKLNARAVFLSQSREQLPTNLPDSVLWQKYAPFNKVLPRVSVFVHHGGIGTLAEASKAGVPQLIVPFAYDQFDNALTIEDLGIGTSVAVQSLTKKKLFNKLSQIQHSKEIKDNCVNISAHFRSGPATGQILDKVLSAI